MKQPSQEQLEKQVNTFNEIYSIGDKVRLHVDDNSVKTVTVSNKATILGGHSAVGWFEEISGCYSLDNVVFHE